jgi:hypothetical protein
MICVYATKRTGRAVSEFENLTRVLSEYASPRPSRPTTEKSRAMFGVDNGRNHEAVNAGLAPHDPGVLGPRVCCDHSAEQINAQHSRKSRTLSTTVANVESTDSVEHSRHAQALSLVDKLPKNGSRMKVAENSADVHGLQRFSTNNQEALSLRCLTQHSKGFAPCSNVSLLERASPLFSGEIEMLLT